MNNGLIILLAEDDPQDVALLSRALAECHWPLELHLVRDGEEALDYLSGKGDFADRIKYPFPDLIILDLKMPKLNGLEVLGWLRGHPDWDGVPAIMMSGSALDRDVKDAYSLGVNTYFEKPGNFSELRLVMNCMVGYWSRSLRPKTKEQSNCSF